MRLPSDLLNDLEEHHAYIVVPCQGGDAIAVGQCLEGLRVYPHDERKPIEPSRVPESVRMMRHAVQHGHMGVFWQFRHILSCNLAVCLVHNQPDNWVLLP